MSDAERHNDENPTTSAAEDDDDDEDYEEPGGGNHFLGFMFGNVDDSGDLDADYLDEDAKEHLFALADKLGSSLKAIDLIKSSPAPTDPSEQDYDEKAEDAVDYEDIDEEYDGPEVEAITEEDNVLSKKVYFSSAAASAPVNTAVSVFDDEDYDEDEEPSNDNKSLDGNTMQNFSSVSTEQRHMVTSRDDHGLEKIASLSHPEDSMDFEYEALQNEMGTEESQHGPESAASLPVLCIEDGSVILRFSEIFGIQEPARKVNTYHHKCPVNKELYITNISDNVEEDEELFLRSATQNISTLKHIQMNEEFTESDSDESVSDVILRLKDSCLSEQPMKGTEKGICTVPLSPVCPEFYPLEHDDWENDIIWNNSPAKESQPCRVVSEESTDTQGEEQDQDHDQVSGCWVVQSKNHDFPVINEPFGCTANYLSTGNSYLPLTKEDDFDHTEPNNLDETVKIDTRQRLNNLCLLNRELLEGAWLDNIIWEPSEDAPKPKLIFDLRDDQMLFEILDEKNVDHLRSHARAMIISQSIKTSTSTVENIDNQAKTLSGRFNISNDKFYSNRKMLQQAKSHTKKRALMGIKVVHSAPAHKLQTMKPILSNKEISNFHRPKAKWYPHENKIATQLQGAACSHGRMTVILMTLGGKGLKFVVDAEKTPVFVKSKASKKLEFKPSEKIKLFCSGKELYDDISLAMQNVRPNSILHVVRTQINLWPKAQMLPGEDKPLRPPGAFRRKTDLSVSDGHVFLMEYCEERPLLLSNAGMGARLCTYYQKTSPADQTATSLRNNSDGLGTVLAIDPADKSPFLGDIRSGSHQSCIETNMYRSPIFPHKVAPTDYLLVRSAKGVLSLRRIDKLYAVGQQEPHMEVFTPGTKNVQNYLLNRLLVYVYREFRAREKPDFTRIRADELPIQSPLTEAIVKKRLKHCADLKKGQKGEIFWTQRSDFRVPSEEELRRLLTPESVCCYESMQAGLYRLKRLGIMKLTQPVGLASAMNQLPDEAIELAAASHIERELQIASWNLTSNFVACTNQDRENIERLEITGVGDPSGRGLGFSYVRVAPKAPASNSALKKKSAAAKGTTVTGTDADLRRLSMDAARELLLKFGVPEEQIDKLTRWHRIAMVRKLSSEQAASGITIDEIPVSKFARGQRMSFLQLQQQTREKCQEIWDRQVQSLSAIDGDDNGSDTEANSDLDSFAGDLENLLDAEEFDDEETCKGDLRSDKGDGMRGLKMRRCPTHAQINEEIEDDEVEASLAKKLLEEDGNGMKRKKQPVELTNFGTSTYNQGAIKMKQSKTGQMIKSSSYVGALTPKEGTPREAREAGNSFAEGGLPTKLKTKMAFDGNDIVLVKKKTGPGKDGLKEKRQGARGDTLVCGACGQLGHMRTNKLCPKYGEDPDTLELDANSVKSNPDVASHVQTKTPFKRLITKVSSEVTETEGLEKTKSVPVKFKCGVPDKSLERNMSLSNSLVSDKRTMDASEFRSTGKVNKLVIPNKMKSDDNPPDTPKPSVVFRPPAEEKDIPRKKITIKQPKGLEQQRHDEPRSGQEPIKKTRKIVELSSFEEKSRQDDHWFAGEPSQINSSHERGLTLEGKRRKALMENGQSWRDFEEQREMLQQRLIDATLYASREEDIQKTKKEKQEKEKT